MVSWGFLIDVRSPSARSSLVASCLKVKKPVYVREIRIHLHSKAIIYIRLAHISISLMKSHEIIKEKLPKTQLNAAGSYSFVLIFK